MKSRDIENLRAKSKAIWNLAQDWIWLLVMFGLIASNLTHIENVLSLWAGTSDWTTWTTAVCVELVNALSFSDALNALSFLLAVAGRKGIAKKDKRLGLLRFILASIAGLLACSFSALANTIWYQWNVLAGITAPVGVLICAVLEGVRRYDVKTQQTAKRTQQETRKAQEVKKKSQQKLLWSYKPAQRRKEIPNLLNSNPQTIQQIADIFKKDRSTVWHDLKALEQEGKIKHNGEGWIAASN